MTCRLLMGLVILALLVPVVSHGQDGTCRIKEISVEKVTNGLRIHLKPDGLMGVSYSGNFWSFSSTQRFKFILNKVTCGADAVVDIGIYPVSHLEFTRPASNTADQVYCTLVLYTPSRLTAFPDQGDESGRQPTDKPQVMVSKNDEEMLIAVVNNHPQEPPNTLTGDGAMPRLSVNGSAQRVSLDVVNTDFHQVAEALSKQTGVPIFVDEMVQNHVTAHLEALPLARLLHVLAGGYGLALNWRDQAFYLSTGQSGSVPSYRAGTVRVVPLQYIMPATMLTMLPDAMLPFVRVAGDAQALVLSGSPQIVDKIEHDIRTLDQPGYQVRIRGRVISCQGSADDLRKVAAAFTSGSTHGESDGLGQLRITQCTGTVDDILANLGMLSSTLQVRLESIPEVTVINGNLANLFVGQDVYYWQLVGSGTQTLDLSMVSVGCKLSIKPKTSGEWITTSLTLEDNFLCETNALGPVMAKQTVNSTLRLRSGDTLLIGGLQLRNADRQHGRVLPQWVPGGDALSRHLASDAQNEVWVLLQAEAMRAQPTVRRDAAEGNRQ